VAFITHDLIYKSFEQKSTKFGKSYVLLYFQDINTKREYRIHDWSGLTIDLEPEQRYYLRGWVNTEAGNFFLVLTDIAEVHIVKDGVRLVDPFKKKDGIAHVFP